MLAPLYNNEKTTGWLTSVIQLHLAQRDHCYTCLGKMRQHYTCFKNTYSARSTFAASVIVDHQTHGHFSLRSVHVFGGMCKVLHVLPPCLSKPAQTTCYLPHHVTQHQIPAFCY
jgi:hypothetical protein